LNESESTQRHSLTGTSGTLPFSGRLRGCAAVIVLLAAGCTPMNEPDSVPRASQTCTAIGCGATLQIGLKGGAPADFVLRAVDSSGAELSVHCLNGRVAQDIDTTSGHSALCGSDGVTFLDFSPTEVTVSVDWVGGKRSERYRPEYRTFRPNGPGCEPECPSARIQFILTDT
jgi:hypothetical protein